MPTILLIEDIEDNASLVRRALSGQDYEIFWAATAEGGLELAEKVHPQLILLDLGLPDIDGQTLVGYIRQVPGLEMVPIVAVSAWPEDSARPMVLAYGCNDFISKPIDVRRFIARVKGYLQTS